MHLLVYVRTHQPRIPTSKPTGLDPSALPAVDWITSKGPGQLSNGVSATYTRVRDPIEPSGDGFPVV